MSKAILETWPDGVLLNENCFCAMVGLEQKGYDIEMCSWSGLVQRQQIEPALYHGSVRFVRHAIQKLGFVLPPNIDFPESLKPFARRKLWVTTLGDIRKNVNNGPVFIKPYVEHKGFNGCLVTTVSDLLETVALPDDYAVLAQQPVAFKSEWRCFVLHGAIIGIGHYRGDPLLFPSGVQIWRMIDAFLDCPVAYSLDVGITGTSDTVLVEVNDAFALGNYGLSAERYTDMIESRWDQIANTRRK